MFNSKSRLAIAVEGSPIAVRFVPHNTDETKVMVKGLGEMPVMFCQAAGVEHGQLFQGENFSMCEASKADLATGIAAFTMKVLEMAQPPKQIGPHPKCSDCGCDDGTHWDFCGTKKNNLN